MKAAVLVFLIFTLNKKFLHDSAFPAGIYMLKINKFHRWLWTRKCWLKCINLNKILHQRQLPIYQPQVHSILSPQTVQVLHTVGCHTTFSVWRQHQICYWIQNLLTLFDFAHQEVDSQPSYNIKMRKSNFSLTFNQTLNWFEWLQNFALHFHDKQIAWV